ncbi:MAG: hypothetical protein DLM57_13345 [Pseudonocardiales bacterium]|nr:MAG: hypothetical protein DLM57_13345 [Pseudonocardiales bacterium]
MIYLRVSTASQVEGTSIDSQRDQCRAAATAHRYDVTGEYVDAGVSGAKTARPALDQLLAAVMAGEVDVVIIAKLDRLGRSLLHLLTLIGQLATLGVRVISACDNIDTNTPAGRMMLQLLGVFAEFERERIRERSREGARRRVTDGGFVSSSPPFGYQAVPDQSGRRGTVLDIEPVAAACIRDMLRLLVRDRTPISLAARALNAAGHRSATGIWWTQHTLSRWARGDGPTTAGGLWRWNDIAVPIPAILTAEQVSEWAAWKADTGMRQTNRGEYLLGGRARTPCGGRYHGRTAGTQNPVYACKRRLTAKTGDPQRCDCRSIRVDTLDHAVWSHVSAALTQPNRCTELLAPAADRAGGTQRLEIGGDTLSAGIADAAHLIGALQQAIAAEYQAAREDGYDPATARMMVHTLHADLTQAHDNLSRLSQVRSAITALAADTTDAHHILYHARRHLDHLDVHGKQHVLDALGVTVQVTGYTKCTTCGGTGYQPIPPGTGRHGPPSCPTCRRIRTTPEVTVHITAPQVLRALTEPPSDLSATAG